MGSRVASLIGRNESRGFSVVAPQPSGPGSLQWDFRDQTHGPGDSPVSRASPESPRVCLAGASQMPHPMPRGEVVTALPDQQGHLAACVSFPGVEATVSLCLAGPRDAEGRLLKCTAVCISISGDLLKPPRTYKKALSIFCMYREPSHQQAVWCRSHFINPPSRGGEGW